jgi:hypothetical protein
MNLAGRPLETALIVTVSPLVPKPSQGDRVLLESGANPLAGAVAKYPT